MITNLQISPASRNQFSVAMDWAAEEGWNPGLDDLDVFHQTDPAGFLMGWIDGTPVSSISVVRYGDAFGFLGFYIVHPAFRARGIGMATWNAGIKHLGNRIIALDGVVDQQANYKKSGFAYVGRNVRFTGQAFPSIDLPPNHSVRQARQDDLPAIQRLDRRCFPAPRDGFMQKWCLSRHADSRHTYVAANDGKLQGVGTIRKCRNGYKIGPLFCENPEAAQALLSTLFSIVTDGQEVSLDVPASNLQAMQIARNAGMRAEFETARMVRGTAPDIDWNAVYGITSFELG